MLRLFEFGMLSLSLANLEVIHVRTDPMIPSKTLVRRSTNSSPLNKVDAAPSLPTELVDYIVRLILSSRSNVVGAPVENEFSCIASFSLASSMFRTISLRRYFSDLQLWSNTQWSQLWKVLGAQGEEAFAWVR